ncbi:c-type cytochrome biogenesis protein CcmI [Methylocapsa sp. D3K7]|uniref:c-type cytochrome biogenesis protein CcmI n=1 Tax=Methylocapsa sp. D3K7 TaxID=3041435 RepID=UPI00244EBCCD|nr:c-type cytochrome biogenesis protein CcmI [Methylocapsa sp. D3K7]WGJ16026.1 c-type cytochrome biogenesis protein CcmI [Methylocapsa sp. D3K7]
MLWLLFAGLTAAAVVSVLWPLAKPPRGVGRRETDIALYKAQLAEIERDEAQNLVALEDAEGAKVEAARRLMAAAETPVESASATSPRRAGLASLAVLFLVPAVSISLYAAIGHPELPDAPLVARLETAPARMDLAAAIAKIEAHLIQHPDDGRGYEVLVPVYLQTGRVNDAVQAASAALRLLGPTAERQALYGETLVAATRGVVTADAKHVFETAAAADPSAPKPRFFLGLAAEQEGDIARAKEIWGKLAAEAPRDAAWAQALRKRIASLDVNSGAPQGPMAAKIEAMPADARMGAIRNMVEGLAARLAQNGQDLEGWLRLVRSYTVLHESGKARAALVDAKRNLADDPNAIARIDALARELGLEG